MEWWLLYWLLLSLVFQNITCRGGNPGGGKGHNGDSDWVSDTQDCLRNFNNILKNGNRSDLDSLETLASVLEETEVNNTTFLSVNRLMAVLHKPKGRFRGLQFYANENEAVSDKAVTNCKVSVQLPRELDVGPNNTIVFCMLTWPEINGTVWGASGVLYESRLVGLSVRGKNISGLKEHVNITVNLNGHGTEEPSCNFFDFSTRAFSTYGCQTDWKPDQNEVTCSCDHLTYFGVLMVGLPSSPSDKDQEVLTYISVIGCSLSLVTLVLTVVLFIKNRKARADISMKVHINLAIALILLNVHFLPNQAVAAMSSDGLCLYMALALHYSLLATFTWMAIEGFHLYLLLVRVFNIYIRKYLLKLSLVGWGFPAVVVSLVVIINEDFYGHFPLDSSKPNSTNICYIGDTTVKMVTTVGVFGLVFLFNVAMLAVTIRRIVGFRQSQEFGPNDRARAKRDFCTLMGVTALLGITWGLVFFSFGHLNTAGLYLFCILNSLQGFFIFLWFLMSLGKTGNQATRTSSETRSSKS
ncbi:adhesion G-protein coupled receptor G5-like [Centropristis striata]|uniref:adhesion G-protein coupled receptor G5-like n=1 Tax=Centropristis striata TaxID=184440 RepID=UPI0027DFF75C|nr:adhesion G-protein coupled receptor G5-like [Centropristis striata]